ncbi:MAG: stalk domain-containing protein, partial [Eubacteriales bacterium]
FKADGTKLRHHTNNIWQCLRMELDTTTGTVLYKINGKKVGEFAVDASVSTVDNIVFGATGGTVYFDDVTVSLTHDYDDYCPAPQPVTDDGYDVWLNICSLWHEGSHSGWGCESAYADIEPALGYYDEGLAEVADWEIKFMVENGIDVQHLCWYCPSGNITEPIKRSNLNWALHDGYFNAKYSDLMKFTFMWENNGQNCTSLEQFKEFIWSYWVDYYFTDDRFYTIDNKIVFTVWNFNNFQNAFGGTVAGAQEAVAFMNEDIKKYGFDGVMIFFADAHRTDAASFEAMANLGATGAYAYHWQQDGVKASTTIPRLQKNQDYGKLHIVPTVSVGFNNIGWSSVRKPMASLEDHRTVLEYIKNQYLTKLDGWKAKTLVVSTWNEYGEGTYVMPCAGLHGFGYLENVAEVISGVTDHSSNIYPTAQQKARLGHLYPKSKTSLERLDLEQPVTETPNAVLYTATGADMEPVMRITESSVDGDVFTGTQVENDAAIAIKADRNFEPTATENIKALRITVKSSIDAYTELFFATKESETLDQAKSFGFIITKSDDFKEYVIDTSTCKAWTGTVTQFRLDILNMPGTFEVRSFELLGLSEEQKPLSISVNSREYAPVFAPELKNGELYVTAEPEAGFFQIHNFYYEWSRYTGKLLIATADNKEIVFTVGSDTASVNGKDVKLAEAVSTKDGIPVLPLYFLYDSLGIKYTLEGRKVSAILFMTKFDEKFEEIIQNRVPYEYEFEILGDTEGFGCGNTTMFVMDGVLKGTALKKSDGSYDPIVSRSGLNIDADIYNSITVRMKHKTENEKNILQVFFTTDTDTTADEAKSFRVATGASSNGEFAEYVINCTENTNWAGKIQTLRFDPISGAGDFEIDYIRVQENAEIRAQKEKEEADRIARGFEIINGDAEDTENVAFFNAPKDSLIEIVKDEESGSHVYKNTAIAGYSYSRQSVIWEPGKKYTVTVDVKLLGTKSGDTDIKTKFHCNARYTDAAGKVDHLVFGAELSPADGWKTLTFSFEIPADVKSLTTDEFTFYTNPANNEGVSYMFDNIKVVVE